MQPQANYFGCAGRSELRNSTPTGLFKFPQGIRPICNCNLLAQCVLQTMQLPIDYKGTLRNVSILYGNTTMHIYKPPEKRIQNKHSFLLHRGMRFHDCPVNMCLISQIAVLGSKCNASTTQHVHNRAPRCRKGTVFQFGLSMIIPSPNLYGCMNRLINTPATKVCVCGFVLRCVVRMFGLQL